MKRFNSRLYTKEKIIHSNRQLRYVTDKNGYLFAQGIYPTKIRAEDLPEWYVYGRFYKCFGYLSAAGVVDMHYVPSKYSNHFLKDDFLFISYHAPIVEHPEESSIFERYSGYDERIYGNEILNFLNSAKRYSRYDVSEIAQQIQKKAEWLPQAFPEEFGDFRFDVTAYLEADSE